MKFSIAQLAMLVLHGDVDNTLIAEDGVWTTDEPKVPHETFELSYRFIMDALSENFPWIIKENPCLMNLYFQNGFVNLYFIPD